MSLLMDALKRAEQAKRQAEGGPTSQEIDLELTPVETAAADPAAAPADAARSEPSVTIAPDLQRRLEQLDDEFAGARREPAQAKAERSAAEETDRAAARNLLAVNKPPSRRGFFLAAGAVLLLGSAAIAGYVWWETRPTSGLAVVPGAGAVPLAARAPLPPAATPPAPPAAPASPAAATAPAAGADKPRGEVVAAPPAAAGRPGATARPARAGSEPAAAKSERAAAQLSELEAGSRSTTRGRLTSEAPAAAAAPPGAAIPIRAGRPQPRVNPDLARAYESYVAGDNAAARAGYERVLRAEPKNGDALLGLAALSLREGRASEAAAHFARALEADPTSAQALAGLVALRGGADPVQAESRLKNLIGAQPEAHAAHFALGNLYAEQGRWGEAQQSFFRAFSADPANPDYLFNLAVSLDQMRQPKTALQYYEKALAAADARPATFERSQVSERVRALQR